MTKKKRGKKLGTKYVPRRYQLQPQKNVGRNCQKHKLVFSKINTESSSPVSISVVRYFQDPKFYSSKLPIHNIPFTDAAIVLMVSQDRIHREWS